ncbi:hypothetical protein CLV51_104154 [Chitinophaga niastensis]|uniref:Uncharacterized protein n=1 Tax=Chitinophaga niastensis TaxID=536980 RepID=A0A2P8HGW2_CHINA|nr:hypothetical protein CLV51_104154 [Chitinophaga niastensis]
MAIIFSAVTLIQKIVESNRGLRKQLTDILEKITSINIESEKAKANSVGFPANYQGLLNDQQRFFVRQAAYLAK